jgi:hypothetical protein
MKWIAIIAVLVALGPLASTRPDGLNRVAADHGFAKPSQSRYGRFGGVLGTLLVAGFAYGIARRVRRP